MTIHSPDVRIRPRRRRRVVATMAVVLGLLAAPLTVPSIAVAQSPNLVVNGGFDKTPTSSKPVPGWNVMWTTPNQIPLSANQYTSAPHSLWIDTTVGGFGLQSDRFSVTAGTRYVTSVSSWLTGPPHMYLDFFDSSGNLLDRSMRTLSTSSWWTETQWSAMAPAGAVKASVFYFAPNGYSVKGYIDDVSVRVDDSPAVASHGSIIHNVGLNYPVYAEVGSRTIAYLPMNGDPVAQIAQVDAATGELIATGSAPGAGAFYSGTTMPNGTAYIGGALDGHLYRMAPGVDGLQDLGVPYPGTSALFGMDVTPSGTVLIGTYPGGRLVEFNPASGSFTDRGRPDANSAYLRAIEVIGSNAYIGVGMDGAKLFRRNLSTGATTQIPLPANRSGALSIDDMQSVGNDLFMRLTDDVLLHYSTTTGVWTDLGTQSLMVNVSPLGPDGRVYWVGEDLHFHSYDPSTRDANDVQIASQTIVPSSKGSGWFNDPVHGRSLSTVFYGGTMSNYSPGDGEVWQITPDVSGAPAAIRSLLGSDDGKIYATGYQSGGLSVFDTATQTATQYPKGTVGQAEGMLMADGKLYLGIYPHADILEFDPAQPFDYGVNPRSLAQLGVYGQDRPSGLAKVGNTLAVGTIPGYGMLQGALTLIDTVTGTVSVHDDIVPDQGVVALAGSGTLIVGGTTIAGGLGTTPSQSTAKLFVWDTVSNTAVWSGTPFPGVTSITALAAAADGTVWGVAQNRLFQFNPTTRTVTATVPLGTGSTAPSWNDAGTTIGFLPNGDLYAYAAGSIWVVDQNTLTPTRLYDGGFHLALGTDCRLYFNDGPHVGSELRSIDLNVARPAVCQP